MVTMDAKGVSRRMLSDILKLIKELILKQVTHMRLRYRYTFYSFLKNILLLLLLADEF